MTVIAVPEAPPIICPSWCVVPQSEHIAELPSAEGKVIHWADDVKINGKSVASLQQMTFPDGTPFDTVLVWVEELRQGEGLSLNAAEQLAAGILELVERARR